MSWGLLISVLVLVAPEDLLQGGAICSILLRTNPDGREKDSAKMFKIASPDLVLLHPPSVYDFRKVPIMFGPISDVVPSTAIFEMYPIGFTTIAEYLGRHGFRVRIVNLALRMLKSKVYDPEKTISRMRPLAFGIDLHWMPHVQGSLEVASICKRIHPDIPVIMGGFSASYFHKDLLEGFPVDYVVRGDSTEEPLRILMEALKRGRRDDLHHVPNLSWKDKEGRIFVNPLSHVPQVLDHYEDNYGHMIRTALKYLDVKSMLPIHDWWSYPITAVMTCRGCVHSCSFCGGGRESIGIFGSRNGPAFRPPERIVEDVRRISSFTSAPIFIVGDLRQAGEKYAGRVLKGLSSLRVKNQVVLELFSTAPKSYFKEVARALPRFNLEMSPESHDPEVRRRSGKFYSNEEMEQTIAHALQAGCRKFDLFFMIGLPGQTHDSVLETVDYCERLLKKFGPRLVPFISPLAPFIDPASPIYENPEKFGYRLFFRTLEEYRTALLQPSWKHSLGYETLWMSRDEIVDVTYEAALRLTELKAEFGLLDRESARKVRDRINLARKLLVEMDKIAELREEERTRALKGLEEEIHLVNSNTLCESREIKWPSPRNFHFLKILLHVLLGRG